MPCRSSRSAIRLGFAESTVYQKQRQAVQRLAAVLWSMESQAQHERWVRIDARLPAAPLRDLVGVDSKITQLAEVVNAAGAPWLVAIEGLGGIGKTTLAAALLRRLIASQRFAEIGWVSGQPAILDIGGGIRPTQQPALSAPGLVEALLTQLAPGRPPAQRAEEALSQLAGILKAAPHLIVVDNLETAADLQALLPTLRTLANPTKIVMTSRKRLIDEHSIYSFVVPDLSEEDTLRLVRQEARLCNLPYLAAASDGELRPIYKTVGGNPLALLLVVGQTHLHSLDLVLHDLAAARGVSVEHLYTFIYRRAWEALDETSRLALLAMPLVNVNGDSFDYIAALSDLPPATLTSALQRLITLNLVNSVGDLHQRRYSIHGLTRSFLIEQVAKWT
jgi:DNA polymerase III delta prime subunit